MYAAADRKLRLIVSTMVEPNKVNALFARVMSLIPPDDLQAILLRHPLGQGPVDTDSIGRLVQQGFNKWKAFHDKYSAEHQKIRQLDPGLAAWEDIDEFLSEHADARPMSGFSEVHLPRMPPRLSTWITSPTAMWLGTSPA